MPAPPYAAIAVYPPACDTPQLLQDANRKVLIFDNAETARNFAPLLGNGRLVCSDGADDFFFTPVSETHSNHLVILTDYDVYNVPAGHPVPSEAKSLAWKHHIIWSEAAREVLESVLR